jgi:exodeoxyribonuclease V alpha subunit
MLCVTRVLDSGSERLNSLMHRRATFDKRMSPERNRFIAGEPVMILRNDYERMLFNGDQGLVLRVQRPGYEATLMAIFPRGDNFVAFNVDALKDRLELCYAMAVHKAQGSEFDSVALIMPDKDVPILTREIIYTAVSRARRSVTIIGSKAVIQTGLSRKIERYTGVREQLAQCLKDSQRE